MIGAEALNESCDRNLKQLPVHFFIVDIPVAKKDNVKTWILEKLKGRFYLGHTTWISKNTSKLRYKMIAGFEDQQELTYFILACPYIKRNTLN